MERSNVVRGDYAGSAACVPCHSEIAAAWERSPMHRMTRDARGAEVHAPFDGATWRFKDDAVVLERRGDERLVRIENAAAPSRTYRVTRVIGGRTREDFAGVEVAPDGRASGEEVVLPVSYLIGPGTLRYKGYSVMVHERSTLHAGPVWARTCIFCHNTVPEMDRLLGAIAGPSAPGYQGEQVDRWLPAERRDEVRVTDAAGFASAAAEEIARLGGVAARGDEPAAVARHTASVVRAGFDGGALLEVGIGCEACHGGAREHTEDPRVHPSLTPVAPWLQVSSPRSTPADAINHACARCHQVLFSRYPYTWEGGRRDAAPGGSHINSGEARDFMLSQCSKRADCTLCHDPHDPDNRERARKLETKDGDAVCTKCHGKYATDDALRAHAHHDPNGAGGRCVACHMPKKNMTLDLELGRYHRIGSPTDDAKMLDRPLECALCHGDWTIEKTASEMERLWGKHIDRAILDGLYGRLDQNILDATLARGKAHERVVAIALFASRGDRRAIKPIAAELVNEYPLVRFYAEHALERITGETSPMDMYATDDEIRAAASAWITRAGSARP
jgi:predicted CXXCH cytochrome family protein